jgi:riboflavin kinase/FMN adenylyltransferase
MQLVRGLHNIKSPGQGTVLTIGNFDGVHRGHQAILDRLIESAKEHDLPSTVMFFEPHPEEVFQGDNAPARLSRCREKVMYFKDYGIDQVIAVKFNQQFSQMSAERFLKELLIEQLGVKYLIVGDDFHFGHKRQGNFAFLKQHAEELGFGLEQTPTLSDAEMRISSTSVRNALANNDLALAEHLLGRPYEMTGKVIHGDKRGRTIGFPTANVLMHRKKSPLSGVYAVRVKLPDSAGDKILFGVANIGRRPTVGGTREQLEVHLFDWQKDIYGRAIQVEFAWFIRGEKRFESFDDLKQQIAADAASAKQFFNT